MLEYFADAWRAAPLATISMVAFLAAPIFWLLGATARYWLPPLWFWLMNDYDFSNWDQK